jgi:uncharacterized SAM-binding protein YcdF (DUF218 family)
LLIGAEPPKKCDAILVLAGDVSGLRMTQAARLAREGFAPVVLVSGPVQFYGQNEADMAIAYMVNRGYPAPLFQPCRLEAESTFAEAIAFRDSECARGLRSLLLVTSDYHTARARRIFRRVFPNLELNVVAAPDRAFRLPDWWHSRESRKTVFLEWSKTFADWLGI